MRLSGIRPYEAIDYNYRIDRAGLQPAEKPQTEELVSKADREQEQARSRQTYTAFDYAGEYNPDAVYEMKGKDSDLASLDTPARPAWTQDPVLQQYTQFVHPEKAKQMQEQAKELENFMLF